jgi:hypothetical protein
VAELQEVNPVFLEEPIDMLKVRGTLTHHATIAPTPGANLYVEMTV